MAIQGEILSLTHTAVLMLQSSTQGVDSMASEAPAIHAHILVLVDYVVAASQLLAILVIIVGMVKALWTFLRDSLFGKESAKAIMESRMELGHAFSLGLGFLIGASILKSAVAPTWDDIGKLASVIAIRTVLNFFLTREISKMIEGRENGNEKPVNKLIDDHIEGKK